MSMYAVVGEKTVTAADGREYRESIEKKYLTIPPYDDGDKRTSSCGSEEITNIGHGAPQWRS